MLHLKLLILIVSIDFSVSMDSPYNYHERVGIKRAEKLRRAELSGRSARIIGGVEVPEEEVDELPYQAGIIIILESGWTSICGGALVSREKVLTAAHCWYDGQNQARLFTVVLGAQRLFFDGLRLVTSVVETHPQWNANDKLHDVAIISIPEVTLTDKIQLIALPTSSAVAELAGERAVISGYGKTREDENKIPFTTSLHRTPVTVISNEECEQSSGALFSPHESHLCTSGLGPVGVCDGDSGGPLVVDINSVRTLIGISSFHLGERCDIGLPSVHTNVLSLMTWIQENL